MLNREEVSTFAIVNFSVRDISHFPVELLQGGAIEAISQLIWCWMLFLSSSQMRTFEDHWNQRSFRRENVITIDTANQG